MNSSNWQYVGNVKGNRVLIKSKGKSYENRFIKIWNELKNHHTFAFTVSFSTQFQNLILNCPPERKEKARINLYVNFISKRK